MREYLRDQTHIEKVPINWPLGYNNGYTLFFVLVQYNCPLEMPVHAYHPSHKLTATQKPIGKNSMDFC